MTPTRSGGGAKADAVAPRPGTQQLPAVSQMAFDSGIGFGSAQGILQRGSRSATRRATEDNNAQGLARAAGGATVPGRRR